MTNLFTFHGMHPKGMPDRGDEDLTNPRAPFNCPRDSLPDADADDDIREFVVTVEFYVNATDHDSASHKVESALNKSNIEDCDLWQMENTEQI
tara:strand:+ start:184 stop:462 length:279 start_codon:yes stop_codon:yes gene_type:complete